MTIRNILTDALRRIGREELAIDMEEDGEPWGEDGEVVKTLLYCINAVEDELARYYFPLQACERLTSQNKLFPFSSFSKTPVRILSVTCGGKEVPHTLNATGIVADCAQIDVTYHYAPKPKTIEGDSEFGDMGDGKITALGAAAEYSLICGEVAVADALETRYREAIDRAQKIRGRSIYVPPRRWV